MTKLADKTITSTWKSLAELSVSYSAGDTLELYNAAINKGNNILMAEGSTTPTDSTLYKTIEQHKRETLKTGTQNIYVRSDVDNAYLMISKIES